MIRNQVNDMIKIATSLKEALLLDIEDIKIANHENLLTRNEKKLQFINEINESQERLNQLLVQAIQNNEDVNQYRDVVDLLEENLKELYTLNGKLASIVLPVKQMYKDIIDDITIANGGSLFEVRA